MASQRGSDPDRLVAGRAGEEERSFELSLRPQRLEDYVGQQKVKNQLSLAIAAARERAEPLDHILLYGPPGLGKTTLATIIAAELAVPFQGTAGPLLQIKGDLTAVLTNLRDRQVLFFDEVHRLQPQLEEVLYSALEDYRLDIIIGQGPAARTHSLNLKPFTFVAATTRAGLVSAPLRSRFGLILRLDFYEPAELEQILNRSARLLNVPMRPEGAAVLARRCRGTPRIANRLLRRVRDFAQVRAAGEITAEVAAEALALLEVDEFGFDEADRRLMLALMEKFGGGPVGVNTLAAVLAEEPDAIEEMYEPYLMQVGFLSRTPRGRVATALAYRHFGLTAPQQASAQSGLFPS
ncbi:MAG: Holliday junction branch migration DNA helicase RuvB [Terriglobales bacterium]